MEETRISRMYLNLLRRALGTAAGNVVQGKWLRSSVTWIVLAVLLLVGVGFAVHEKGRGNLHRLKTQLGDASPTTSPTGPMPGGQAPVILTRQHGGMAPEFVSTTLLPGRGMNVLQIMASLPGKGIVPLLVAPDLATAAQSMSGTGDDVTGQASLTSGAAIEVPWAARLTGPVMPGGLAVVLNWHGRTLTLPANWSLAGIKAAEGGLLLRTPASPPPSAAPDGSSVEANFNPGDFQGHWPSKTQVETTARMTAATLELTVTARNVGSEPEPMGIGWRPRFALVGANRSALKLKLPSATGVETQNDPKHMPTGRLVSVAGTQFDFSRPGGATLPAALDELYASLTRGTASGGPQIELRNPTGGYMLRMTLLSPSIKAIRVEAPANGTFLSIRPQTNYDDPLGREWPREEDTGLVVLQPQESLQWKVRLELLRLPGSEAH